MKYSRRQHFARIKQQANQRKKQPLTPRDQQLLSILRDKYIELGRSPTISEVPEAPEIKTRFGLWKYALEAANLPILNDPEQQKIRLKEMTQAKKDNICCP